MTYGNGQAYAIAANTGYYIADVTVDGVSQGPLVTSYTFSNVIKDHAIAATFAANPVITASSSGPAGSGSITPNGAVSVNYGADQSFTIAATTGYYVADVTVDGVSQGPISSYTFSKVKTNGHTIAATFASNPVITASSSGPAGSGSITPNGAVSVNYGTDQSFAIAATTGYYIVGVTVDGVPQGAISSYTFSAVKASHSIAATFDQKTLKIASAPTSASVGNAFTVVLTETPGGPTPGDELGLRGNRDHLRELDFEHFPGHDLNLADDDWKRLQHHVLGAEFGLHVGVVE